VSWASPEAAAFVGTLAGAFVAALVPGLILAWRSGKFSAFTHQTELRLTQGNTALADLRKVDLEQADQLGMVRTHTQTLEARVRALEEEIRTLRRS